MTLPADVLRDSIIQTEQQEEDCDKSIEGINSQIAELQKKQDGIKDGYCNPIKKELTTYLESLFPAPNHLACGKTLLFNDSTNSYGTGNLTDFCVLEKQKSNSEWEMVSSTTIKFNGDVSSQITGPVCAFGTILGDVLSNQSDGSPYTVVVETEPITLLQITYVICSLSIVTSQHNWLFCGDPVMEYDDPVDPNVDPYITKWEFGHDYICKEVGTGGTYGTKDMMSKLNTSKGIIQTNKAKIVESRSRFETYATPE